MAKLSLVITIGTYLEIINILRMLTVYFLVSCVLSATYAVAVEHPVRRYSRSHDGGRGSLRLSVKPEFIEMRRGDTVTIRCRARGSGDKAEETPFITFYRKVTPNTVMPLSTHSYGVSIKTPISQDIHTRFHKSVKTLTLNSKAYDTLFYGNNRFYCKGSTMKGKNTRNYFVIRKV